MFKLLMKGVQAHGEVDEEELDDALLKANEDQHRLYAEKHKSSTKDVASDNSVCAAASDFDEPDSDEPKKAEKSCSTREKGSCQWSRQESGCLV